MAERRARGVRPAPDEDLEQAAALARLEATASGSDPDAAEAEAREGHGRDDRRWAALTLRDAGLAGLDWLPESARVVGLSPPARQTPGQRRKFLRNQLILAGHLSGFSQRQLGDVFDLPHSRISAILDEMRARAGIAAPAGPK